MNEILLIASIITLVFIVGAFVWLIGENKRLKQDLLGLRADIERNNKDIAGLCSAAVSVDNRLTTSSDQLKNIVEKVTDFEQHEQQTTQPYHSAIQRVRNGASAEELTKECGLSRDEAVLLIRLHGE